MGNISCKGNEEGGTDGCDLIRIAEEATEPRAGQPERVDENKRGFGCADRENRGIPARLTPVRIGVELRLMVFVNTCQHKSTLVNGNR